MDQSPLDGADAIFDACLITGRKSRPIYEQIGNVQLHVTLELIEMTVGGGEDEDHPAGRYDNKTIFVYSDIMKRKSVPPQFLMDHELGHALHDAKFGLENYGPYTAEGFALFLQLDHAQQYNVGTDPFSMQIRDALITAQDSNSKRADILKVFSGLDVKIRGYNFFRKIVEQTGAEGIIWDILEAPPQDVEEVLHPEIYIRRVF